MLGATLCRLRFNMYCIYDRNLQHVNQWKPSWFMSTLSIRLQDVAARSLSQAMGSESMNIYHPQWFRFIHSSTPDLKDFTMDTPICLPDFPAGGTWNGRSSSITGDRKESCSKLDGLLLSGVNTMKSCKRSSIHSRPSRYWVQAANGVCFARQKIGWQGDI